MRSALRNDKSVKRPTGVTAVAVLTFFGAAILALGSLVLFFVGVMAMTGGAAEEPVSVALSGMGVGGGFLLLILAGVATSLAIGVLKLRELYRSHRLLQALHLPFSASLPSGGIW
jgi:hypothetical protein